MVRLKGTWKEETEETVIVNVYSPCNMVGKKAMWNELIDLKTRWGNGIWVVAGDFNAVRKNEKRKGRNNLNGVVSTRELMEFNNFINMMKLQDIPIIGQLFT